MKIYIEAEDQVYKDIYVGNTISDVIEMLNDALLVLNDEVQLRVNLIEGRTKLDKVIKKMGRKTV